ncbi:hypothetical protein AJ78_00158 [Emergomyces pasteurianus Ep9510]|uniref:Uncharacterized protein n=1 Tax=Emergomyces pasteurianus Ep9510 TaxID=1447872 RepID=A0A1J9QVS6_9EURO|nr:hypothetical protein AJ78_00158 [Emergomyces pasteurianus Ep9510]
MASKSPLAPANISYASISLLLSLYPHTIKEFYRRKLISKSTPKANTKLAANRPSSTEKNEENREKEVEAFLTLDKLRYETIPAALKSRVGVGIGENDEEKEKQDVKRRSKKVKLSKDNDDPPLPGPFLEKDEIVHLMDWKLKHGSHRPALMGMIRSNPDSLVQSTTRSAFAQLQKCLSNTGDEGFPAAPLETLTGSLRGVGPATASLFLSIAPCQNASDEVYDSRNINAAPFFSDELFNWLCLDKYAHDFPNSSIGGDDMPRSKVKKSQATTEAKIRYNMKEYRELWEAVRELRGRVNKIPDQKVMVGKGSGTVEGESRSFSVLDIERVAFVIGHLDVSGYTERIKEESGMRGLGAGEEDDVSVVPVPVVASSGMKTVNAGRGKRKRG